MKPNLQNEPNESNQLKQIVSFDNGLLTVYNHNVFCYRLSDNFGWQCVMESGFIENEIISADLHTEFSVDLRFMLVVCCHNEIILFSNRPFTYLNQPSNNSIPNRGRNNSKMYEIEEIGRFHLNNYPIESMFFIGQQLGRKNV